MHEDYEAVVRNTIGEEHWVKLLDKYREYGSVKHRQRLIAEDKDVATPDIISEIVKWSAQIEVNSGKKNTNDSEPMPADAIAEPEEASYPFDDDIPF